MSNELLTLALRFIAQLNEFTPIFIIWIVSPPTTSECWSRSSLSASILKSIGYAISEPLYTSTLARLLIDPAFLFVMTAVLHGFQILWLWITLDGIADFHFRDARRRDQEARSDCESATGEKLDAEDYPGHGSHSSSTKHLDWKIQHPFVFAHVQTAAASSAALLLAAQTADVTHSKSHTIHVILLAAGLFYFFLSRLADCYLAHLMGLPLYFGQHWTTKLTIPQSANLLLTIALRAGVRWFAGMEAFAGSWGNGAHAVEKFVGVSGILEWFGHAPRWLAPFLLILSPCLMYLVGRFSVKTRTE
jgi:hypothetical protein